MSKIITIINASVTMIDLWPTEGAENGDYVSFKNGWGFENRAVESRRLG